MTVTEIRDALAAFHDRHPVVRGRPVELLSLTLDEQGAGETPGKPVGFLRADLELPGPGDEAGLVKMVCAAVPGSCVCFFYSEQDLFALLGGLRPPVWRFDDE